MCSAQLDAVLRSDSDSEGIMLTVGMVVLGLATFAAMLGFVAFCDRV